MFDASMGGGTLLCCHLGPLLHEAVLKATIHLLVVYGKAKNIFFIIMYKILEKNRVFGSCFKAFIVNIARAMLKKMLVLETWYLRLVLLLCVPDFGMHLSAMPERILVYLISLFEI